MQECGSEIEPWQRVSRIKWDLWRGSARIWKYMISYTFVSGRKGTEVMRHPRFMSPTHLLIVHYEQDKVTQPCSPASSPRARYISKVRHKYGYLEQNVTYDLQSICLFTSRAYVICLPITPRALWTESIALTGLTDYSPQPLTPRLRSPKFT